LIENIVQQIKKSGIICIINKSKKRECKMYLNLSQRQKEMTIAGGFLNLIKSQKKE